MSLDPMFETHLEKMRSLHEELKADIDKGIETLNLDDVLTNPKAELTLFAEELALALAKKFSTRFIYEGVRFADNMRNTKRKIEHSVPQKTGSEND
jgi:hypothetical protein